MPGQTVDPGAGRLIRSLALNVTVMATDRCPSRSAKRQGHRGGDEFDRFANSDEDAGYDDED
jgi:hypothetical protein